MTTALIVDIEKLVGNYLRAHTAVTALNTRIVGKTPKTTATSWVRLTKLSSPSVNYPERLVEFMVQLDVYAGATGGQPEAILNARTIRAALCDLPGLHTEGVVCSVRILGGPREPDIDFEDAREREILTAIIYAHA